MDVLTNAVNQYFTGIKSLLCPIQSTGKTYELMFTSAKSGYTHCFTQQLDLIFTMF